MMRDMKQMLFKRFVMKDLGPIHYIFGWEITRNRQARTIFIKQKEYAKKVLQRFAMDECNGCKVSSDPSLRSSKAIAHASKAVTSCYRKFDVPYARDPAGLRFHASSRITQEILHWRTAKHGLRYLKETMDRGLRLGRMREGQELPHHLEAFADADFANRVDDRSQTEKTVALHTTEAEYMALSLLVQEGVHVRQMLKELKMKQKEPSDVYVDNESAMKLAKNQVFHSRTKHIYVFHHFIRERIELMQINVKRVPGEENMADTFTYPLPPAKFEKQRSARGLLSQDEYEST
ncbi:polyprotein [Phytophthora megakarya]|uniref:Polyprotein n=1 Tax=Phytophthora megakarya TaxID=4795 RepID=A0A225UPZ9_9STRA|nr:polyprotein [Phytophthora megakarya]